MNWIVPGKFIAFMGPIDSRKENRGNSPEDYMQVFKHFGVGHVVRLNEAMYDKTKFTRAGFKHTDLFFIDGSTPSDVIIYFAQDFI
jgi:cell division cycle 14